MRTGTLERALHYFVHRNGSLVIDLIARNASAVRWTFLRGLALVWLAAFVSLGVQNRRACGSRRDSARGRLSRIARDADGAAPIARLPTLCWWLGTGEHHSRGDLRDRCRARAMPRSRRIPGTGIADSVGVLPLAGVACTTFLNFHGMRCSSRPGSSACSWQPWQTWAPGLCSERPPRAPRACADPLQRCFFRPEKLAEQDRRGARAREALRAKGRAPTSATVPQHADEPVSRSSASIGS